MKSNINGSRKYQIDKKTGIVEDLLSFYPESYLINKKKTDYYISLNTEDIICDFIIQEKLGEGAFGSVHLGINKQTGEKVAIKILEKCRLTRNRQIIRLNREIEILKKVKHPNIIQLYSVIETEKQIFLIMEYIKGKELYQYIVMKTKIPEDEACFFFQQIISGIEYLNDLKIAHRDIKSENILIEENTKTIKIIDFGLSNTYSDKNNEILSTACGSPFYAAPEMLKGDYYKGSTVDIWSVGVVLFAMLCGYLPFEDEDRSNLYKKIINGKYSIPMHVSNYARELIYQLLEINPKKRITIPQIKKHSWIKYYNKNGKPIFNVGLNINKYIIPIDEDIIDEMEKQFHLEKVKIRIDILTNKSNDFATLYYLMVLKKKNIGKKSISYLKSKLFLHYLKDKKNLLSYYKNNFKDIIDARKYGVYFNYDNINSEDEEPLENYYYSVESENDIILTKKKIPVFIQKILNPIYHSFYLKKKSVNTQKPSKTGKNKNKSAEK